MVASIKKFVCAKADHKDAGYQEIIAAMEGQNPEPLLLCKACCMEATMEAMHAEFKKKSTGDIVVAYE